MDQQAKQQVIERLKTAEHILVTVSTNPSVDQLAACIGTALMMNKLQKHATAVYSGQTPSTLEFLQPEKTLETNTNSLRDFIISLDKNKADKLRYKVEDKFVRIYITPYRTSLDQSDLEFTQGDYNVDLILALGVLDKAHIDAAIAAQGKILHDAATVCIIAGQSKTQATGQINWVDPTASSLSEMMVSISEALGTGLIDNQIATSFLTGIVSETERFSNSKTSSKVMTMSAQLMAAGANQQLIATKLATPPEPPPPPPPPPPSAKPAGMPPKKPQAPPAGKDSGEITIEHEDKKSGKASPNEIRIDDKGNIEKTQDLLRAKKQAEAASMPPRNLPEVLPRTDKPMPEPTASVAPAPVAPAPAPAPEPPAPVNPMAPPPAADANSPITTFRHGGDHDMFAPPLPGQTPFSSASSGGEEAFYDPMSPDHKQPDSSQASGGFFSKSTDPVVTNAPPVDFARGAVDSAISSAPYDAAHPEPAAALNAQPMAELHMPPEPAPVAAPPPVPPPIPLSPTPLVPAAVPSPAKASGFDSAPVNPAEPNTTYPM